MKWNPAAETIATRPEETPPKTAFRAPPGYRWQPGPIEGLPERTIPELDAQRRAAERRRALAALGCAAVTCVPVLAVLAEWVTLHG